MAIIAGCSALYSCSQSHQRLEEKYLCVGLLCQPGGREMYLIEVSSDGIIKTSFGYENNAVYEMQRNDSDFLSFKGDFLSYTDDSVSRKLTSTELRELKTIIQKTEKIALKNTLLESECTDVWTITLLTPNNQFVYQEGCREGNKINGCDKLLKKLVFLSPMKIYWEGQRNLKREPILTPYDKINVLKLEEVPSEFQHMNYTKLYDFNNTIIQEFVANHDSIVNLPDRKKLPKEFRKYPDSLLIVFQNVILGEFISMDSVSRKRIKMWHNK